MRSTILVIGLMLMFLLSGLVGVAIFYDIFSGNLKEETFNLIRNGVALFAALLCGIAAIFALEKPKMSIVLFVLAAVILFITGTIGAGIISMNLWAVISLILALLSFYEHRKLKNKKIRGGKVQC